MTDPLRVNFDPHCNICLGYVSLGKYCACEHQLGLHMSTHPHPTSGSYGMKPNCDGFKLIDLAQKVL